MTTTYDNLQVDIGNAPNDDAGDTLRTAFDKINQRFAELRIFANGRGDWAPSTVYTANPNRDWVIFEGEGYLATSNHTSGATFAADLAAGKWVSADAVQLRAELASAAAGKGAELVAFKQAGAGAVDRTALEKMRETVSKSDYSMPSEALFAALSGSARFVDNDQTTLITVGSGGTVATINAALSLAEKVRPVYKTGGVMVEIRLLSGFVMAEQVIVDGKDFSFCKVTSVDTVVTIQRSALTSLVFFDYYPAWCAQNGATLPVIDCLFTMDASGTATFRDAFFINYGSNVIFEFDAGCTNAGSRGLHVANGSVAVARKTNFSGALEIGVRVSGASVVQLRDATVTGCGSAPAPGETAANLAVDGGCVVYAAGATLSSGVNFGVSCLGSQISLYGATVSGCGSDNVRIRRGSSADLGSMTAINAGQDAIYIESSTANAANAVLTDAARFGLYAVNSRVYAPSLSAHSCGSSALNAISGASVDATGATLTSSGSNAVDCIGSAVTVDGATITGAVLNALNIRRGSTCNARAVVASGAGQDGIFCEASVVYALSANVSNATRHGINASGGRVFAQLANANACGQNAIQGTEASQIDATSATLTNAGASGAIAIGMSLINCRSANASGSVSTGFTVGQGGQISASLATGTLSRAANTIGAAGIIFQ